MSTLYSTDDIEPKAPNYSLLMDWFRDWPEARPELLDFWSRGGFMSRNIQQTGSARTSIAIAVRYIDELDYIIKRVALLGLDINLIWMGHVEPPSLVVAPQDVDYEGVGGWGYLTCSGDELLNRHSEREWAPALAIARLVPDSVTDWMIERASDFFSSGRASLAPAVNIGVPIRKFQDEEILYERITGSSIVCDRRPDLELLFDLDLPRLEDMSLGDVWKFCLDHDEELKRFRTGMLELIRLRDGDVGEIVREIRDSVREIQDSARYANMRNLIIGIGGALATFNLGIATGLPAHFVAGGSVAQSALQWWVERTIARSEIKKKHWWPIWKMQRGRQQGRFRKRRLVHELTLPEFNVRKERLSHWLAPASGGWEIPTAFIPR